MPPSDDIALRRAIVTAIDSLPQASADLRARTLARFRREAVKPAGGRMQSKRVIALTLWFLPAIVAGPLAATLGIEQPMTIDESVSRSRSVRLLSKLLRIA